MGRQWTGKDGLGLQACPSDSEASQQMASLHPCVLLLLLLCC